MLFFKEKILIKLKKFCIVSIYMWLATFMLLYWQLRVYYEPITNSFIFNQSRVLVGVFDFCIYFFIVPFALGVMAPSITSYLRDKKIKIHK